MITRLRVKGFKNLQNVDVFLGPLTCLAGLNGVGKSNFFDALLFLKHLADKSFLEAAQSVRGGEEQLRNLFTASAQGDPAPRMELSADLLIPRTGKDEFNQPAVASSTFVTYSVALRLMQGSGHDLLQLEKEALSYIPMGQALQHLPFGHKADWRKSVVHTDRRAQFISTDPEAGLVKLHQDRPRSNGHKKVGGRSWGFQLDSLPRTVLSSARNAQESPTAVLVRAALRKCRLLQLEPSSLRQPDDFSAESHLTADGSHLPATFSRLADQQGSDAVTRVSNRLAELLKDVRSLRVQKDLGLRRLTLYLRDFQGVEFPAVSLSDGTLRFLALTVLEMDPEETGVLCLEEPENGVHPERIEAMLTLLKDIATDPSQPAGDDNPLRQVLLSTHSPTVAELVAPGDLLFARSGARGLEFQAVDGTWRTKKTGLPSIPPGAILNYLRPTQRNRPSESVGSYFEQLGLPF